MKYLVNFEEKALIEFNDAITWHEEQKEGLGSILRDDIMRQILEIDKDR